MSNIPYIQYNDENKSIDHVYDRLIYDWYFFNTCCNNSMDNNDYNTCYCCPCDCYCKICDCNNVFNTCYCYNYIICHECNCEYDIDEYNTFYCCPYDFCECKICDCY